MGLKSARLQLIIYIKSEKNENTSNTGAVDFFHLISLPEISSTPTSLIVRRKAPAYAKVSSRQAKPKPYRPSHSAWRKLTAVRRKAYRTSHGAERIALTLNRKSPGAKDKSPFPLRIGFLIALLIIE